MLSNSPSHAYPRKTTWLKETYPFHFILLWGIKFRGLEELIFVVGRGEDAIQNILKKVKVHDPTKLL